jgi:hypothetical protein
MIKVFAGKVRKTGFFQKAGFPGNSDRIFGICYKQKKPYIVAGKMPVCSLIFTITEICDS